MVRKRAAVRKRVAKTPGIRRAPPDESDTTRLRELVGKEAPNGVPDIQEQAIAELLAGIHEFRRDYPYAEGDARTRGGVSSTRRVLGRLDKALTEALAAVDALQVDIDAMRLFCTSAGHPVGRAKRLLQPLADAAQAARSAAKDAPNKSSDLAPAWLASIVVRVLRDTLGVRVARTSDRNSRGTRGGGAYARMLRATLEVAGATPPDDLMDTMRKGLTMADL